MTAHDVHDALIAPRVAPVRAVPITAIVRRLLFPSPSIGLVSVVLVAALIVYGARFASWALLNAHWLGISSEACAGDAGACWAFVIARWKPWLVGNYPLELLWRPATCFAVFALFCLWAVTRENRASIGYVLAGLLVLPVVMFAVLRGGGRVTVVPPTQWGGLLLTLVVTLGTLATALPLGLGLALGRRSSMPIVRGLCTAFVEGMRAIPLLAVLFIAATLLPMFLPRGVSIDLFWRAALAFALFNAALAAEVFRGGLQWVGRGQLEAATTVGLGRLATLRLVVPPQAVRAVVPALVNIMIAVIKETTLLSVIGVNDLLSAVENGAKSPDWMGESNILASGYVFLAIVYLTICYGLSRYSRRFEVAR
jgi:general L-amino acid transport system permease protein